MSDLRAIPLMQCPIAGFQFHGGEECFSRMSPGDALELRREPGNRHDSRAITIEWNRVVLGYVPKEANYAISQMMDRGARLGARIASLRKGSDPWHRVMIDVEVEPPSQIETGTAAIHEILLRKGPQLSNLATVRAPLLSPFEPHNLGPAEAALRVCKSEIARRLASGLRGIRRDAGREVILWGTLRVSVDARGLRMSGQHVDDGCALHEDFLTVDLKRPLGKGFWYIVFAALIGPWCARDWAGDKERIKRARRWVADSLWLTFEDHVECEANRKAALEFLAPDPLARSLCNRVFGASAGVERFSWVGARRDAIALCAVEQPGMLPFLPMVRADESMQHASDPLAALLGALSEAGLVDAAWKGLPKWGYATFEALGHAWVRPAYVAQLANLLHAMELKAPPPRGFVKLAVTAARHGMELFEEIDEGMRLDSLPAWFMRALLQASQFAAANGNFSALESAVPPCVEWIRAAKPQPDSNQQAAGWPWIVAQAQAWQHGRKLAMLEPWKVPLGRMAWPPCYSVAPITSAAELEAEAKAMKNCLRDYEEVCRRGDMVVYSVRHNVSGDRLACFAAERESPFEEWRLYQVAGKKNASVSDALVGIARRVVVKMNLGKPDPCRGG